MEMLSYDFMRRALVVGAVISLVCPTIGIFLVLRRFSMLGDTLSHISLAGVAVGMISGVYPIYTAIAMSVIASVGIEKLRKQYERYAELTLSIFLAFGVGLASILINLFGGKTNGIMSYLFGSISLVTRQDQLIVMVLGMVILVSTVLLYRGLFFLTFDEEAAKIAGVNAGAINLYFSIMVALTITISMRIVGILMVSSLIVIPVAASLQIAKSFKQAFIWSNVFSFVSVVVGLTISFYMDIAPGGTIIMISIAMLMTAIAAKAFMR